ncbi:MAG: helix-turn-helix transcriptional regulator [Bacteroides sp.]|nr:helix-turn-helix transcriptional regulator [Bacteroides sp.]
MKLRVKEILKTKSLDVKGLADILGINRVSLSNTINGNPTVETLQKIASALGVELWELFTESTRKEELNALVQHKGDFCRAGSVEELEKIVEQIQAKSHE